MNLPPYVVFPVLSGERVSLRQISNTEIIDLIEISFYDGIKAKKLDQASQFHEYIIRDYEAGKSIYWGIMDNLNNQLVGTCGYYRGFKNRSGELGCILLDQFRKKGFMFDALQLSLYFGFNSMDLERVFAITSKQNMDAIVLLERLDFVGSQILQTENIEFEIKKK